MNSSLGKKGGLLVVVAIRFVEMLASQWGISLETKEELLAIFLGRYNKGFRLSIRGNVQQANGYVVYGAKTAESGATLWNLESGNCCCATPR